MKNILERKCSRKGCTEIGLYKIGINSYYCPKHYRFREMRGKAQQGYKTVPSWDECEEMLQPCLNEKGELGKCPYCRRQMRWKCGNNKKRSATISLQHNHDGTMGLICTSCNAGHGPSKLGDAYLDIPTDEKYCPDCDEIKLRAQFPKNRVWRNGPICKECCRKRNRAYQAAINADPEKRSDYLAKARKRSQRYRAAKRQEVLT